MMNVETEATKRVNGRMIRGAVTGQTVAVIVDGAYLLIVMADGQYAGFVVNSSEDGTWIEQDWEPIDEVLMLKAGLLTQGEFDEYKAAYQKVQEEWERRRYLELRQKYEGKEL
jgi:hypothetical protein